MSVTNNEWTGSSEVTVDSEPAVEFQELKWLEMPMESKVLLTWIAKSAENSNYKIWGQFFDVDTGAKVG
jgi:hypothetical protein